MTGQHNQGYLFVLVGPGGAGKNVLLKAVLKRTSNLTQLATATTRGPRSDEINGVHRLFVTLDEFRRMIRDNELAEHQEVHQGVFYGVPRASIEQPITECRDLIADIDMHGANTLRLAYPNNVILVFITPPGDSTEAMLEVLRQRLEARQESVEDTKQRLQRAPAELAFAPQCDYLIVNDDLEKAAEMLYGIILAERSRRALMALRGQKGMPQHHFAYAVSVILMYGSEVLYHSAGKHFPAGRLLHGELPHEAALRLVNELLGQQAQTENLLRSPYGERSASDFVAPLLMEYEAQHYEELVVFDFIYQMNERTPIVDWEWLPAAEVDLPQGLPLVNEMKPMA
ncbi:MAG: hypothetical protein HXY40_07790 [Chloroflexi bacterium]|nr:hypothetical protein [Chloroflexota bacterium]